jgi:hypothetical protein
MTLCRSQALCSFHTLAPGLRSYLLTPPAAPKPQGTTPPTLPLPACVATLERGGLGQGLTSALASSYNTSQLAAVASCLDKTRQFALVQVRMCKRQQTCLHAGAHSVCVSSSTASALSWHPSLPHSPECPGC